MANLSESFGKRVLELRKQQDLTQEQLGEKAELHPTYIGAIERGEQIPSLETIEKLASGLDVDLKALFDFNSKKLAPTKDSNKKRLTRLLNGRSEKECQLGLGLLEEAFRWTKKFVKK